jgi:hypothetical protein
MTDEQIEKLIESLKPLDKGRWPMLLDNALAVVIGALTVGFFGLLWQLSNDTDKKAAQLDARAVAIEQSVLGVQETLKRELGDLAAPIAIQSSIKEAVLNQNKTLQELAARIDALEQGRAIGGLGQVGTSGPVVAKPPVLRTNEPWANAPLFPSAKSDEIIKAIRAKEDAVDQRFRNYEQRSKSK